MVGDVCTLERDLEMAYAVGGLMPSKCLLNTKTKHSSSSSSYLVYFNNPFTASTIKAESMATEKLGIKIQKNPPESKLTQLGVRNWPKYLLFSSISGIYVYICV